MLAPLTRISSIHDAINEQKGLDIKSLRKVDSAEASLSSQHINYTQYHALNLYNVNQNAAAFYDNVSDYINKNKYRYALASDTDWGKDKQKTTAKNIIMSDGKIIKTFPGHDLQSFDITEGSVGDIRNLFRTSSFGPTVNILDLSSD